MNWYVFSIVPEDAEESLAVFGSYAEAVLEAQCRHDTQNRPKREIAEFYTLRGENHASHIATGRAMKQCGFGNLLTAELEMKRSPLLHLRGAVADMRFMNRVTRKLREQQPTANRRKQ